MTKENKPAYWAVIPARVRYDEELRPNAKLLYGEIQALADRSGYCWATNEYLARLYGLAARTVSDLISGLARKGYLKVEVLRDEKTHQVLERRIWVEKSWKIVDLPPRQTGVTPPEERGGTPPTGNGGENKVKPLNKIPPKAPQGGRRRNRSPRKAPDWKPERFAGFWEFYPRGENKQRAMNAWDRLQPDDETIDAIAKALVVLKESDDWQRENGKYIPHASTFLNNARWEDARRDKPPEGAGQTLQEERGAYPL